MTEKFFNKKTSVLHNSLDKDIVSKPKVNCGKIVKLLYIGNISQSKGTFDLVTAVNQLTKVKLTIVGGVWKDKKDFNELLENIDSSKISFLGFANEKLKKELLSSHDIFCLPSKLEEGSPISLIEAFSYGLPIIATNKGCIPNMIRGCGSLIEGRFTPDNLESAIKIIKNNYKKYSKYSIENYANNYSKTYFIKKLTNILSR